MHTNYFRRGLILTFAILVLSGCGAPQFSAAGRDLMKPLQTAISAKKLDWINAVEQKLKMQLSSGQITQAEHDSLQIIVQKSRSGDWKVAAQKLTTLIDGQRATANDLSRLTEKSKGRAMNDRSRMTSPSQ
jgi:hypothetical protein